MKIFVTNITLTLEFTCDAEESPGPWDVKAISQSHNLLVCMVEKKGACQTESCDVRL